jgi:murein DD-endopeptidase MepM/ murein hydrolase activator NlpD
LWSFRPEYKNMVVGAAASEVARDAGEAYAVNLASNPRLNDRQWLLRAKPEDMVAEYQKLEDPKASARLRELSVLAPQGAAPAVAGYEQVVQAGRMKIRMKETQYRLENNSALVTQGFGNTLVAKVDEKEGLIQADKDGDFGNDINEWTDQTAMALGQTLTAEANRLGVAPGEVLQRTAFSLFTKAEGLAQSAREEQDAGGEPDTTELRAVTQQIALLRAVADSPSMTVEGISPFSVADEKGISMDDRLNQFRKEHGLAVASIKQRSGESAAAEVYVRTTLDPEQSKESLGKLYADVIAPMVASGNWTGARAALVSMQQGQAVKTTNDKQAEAAQSDLARQEVAATIILGGTVSEEDKVRLAQMPGAAGLPALQMAIEYEAKQAAGVDAQESALEGDKRAKVQEAITNYPIDNARLRTAAIDVVGQIKMAQKEGSIDPKALDTSKKGEANATTVIEGALSKRTKSLFTQLVKAHVDANGVPPTEAEAEEYNRQALSRAQKLTIEAYPAPPNAPGAGKSFPWGQAFRVEDAGFRAILESTGGRPDIRAIPKRIREQALKENPKANFNQMLELWNSQSDGIVAPDGKKFYTTPASESRRRVMEEIKNKAKANGTEVSYRSLPADAPPEAVATLGRAAEGWNAMGFTPEEVGLLSSVAPKSEMVSVDVPATGGRPAEQGAGAQQQLLPPALPPTVVQKVADQMLRAAGVDPGALADGSAFMPRETAFQPTADMEGMAVPVAPGGLAPAPAGMVGDPLSGQAGGASVPPAPGGAPPAAPPAGAPLAGAAAPVAPMQNLTPSNVERVGRIAAGREPLTASTPPLPQADASLPSIVISPNARSKNNPWVYAVLATSTKVQARMGNVGSTLPGWMFPESQRIGINAGTAGGYGGRVEKPANVIIYESPSGQGGFDIYMESRKVPALLPGVVKETGWEPGYGNFAVVESIDPRNGKKVDMLYGHIGQSKGQGFNVREGQPISAGTTIGQQGSTGNVKNADSIMSVDFLAPAAKGSNSMTKYSDFMGLRAYVGNALMRGELVRGPSRALGGTSGKASLVMNEQNPYVVAIGIAEGNLDANGRPTGSYAGHTDPGNGARNVGIFSAQGSGGSPEAANRVWFNKLNKMAPRFDAELKLAGLQPGTPAYDRIMFNMLDLYVQSPAAVTEAGGLLSRVPEMVRDGGSVAAIANARAMSFRNPATGNLDAPGFGNSWSRLLKDQRSRAGAFDNKKRG